MLNQEELDEKVEDTEDADLEQKKEDDEDGEKDETEDDEDDSDEGDQKPPEDDEKPVTKGELKKILASNRNDRNANRRVSEKGRDKPAQSPKDNERISNLEKSQGEIMLLERKRQFAYDNSLSPAEADHIFKLNKNPTKKFLEDPFVKGGLQAIRTIAKTKANIPGSSAGRSFSANGKSWKDLPPEEKEANFAARRQAILEEKKSR